MHDLGRLLDGEAREEAQFDDPALALVEFRQAVQRIVQAEQIDIGADLRHGHGFIERQLDGARSAPACCERA
jgi:hypothetical protein